jgi:tRNA threonylcarbamoyladenosine biosynthesis protein TsaE
VQHFYFKEILREVAAVLNARNDVSSPSFALIHQYKADININHIDLYRIRNAKEITNLGLDEILNSDSINFIEWPQIIESSIQWTHFRIMIKNSPVYQSGRKYEVFKLW